MKPYADTNLFTNLWLNLSHTTEASQLLVKFRDCGGVLPVTLLHKLELMNAFQRLVFESRHGNQAIRVSSEAAMETAANFHSELDAGEFLKIQTIPDETLETIFERLAYRHTPSHGFRTYDVMHVASAIAIGCDTFWSFDAKARKLASLEGLKING